MARLSRPWKELKQDLYRDPEFRKAYEVLEPEFQLARAIIVELTRLRRAQVTGHPRKEVERRNG